MEQNQKDQIYARLQAIKLTIEPTNVPNPGYINEKIGQCHVFIQEVESYYITVCKEISVIQRALNNARAA